MREDYFDEPVAGRYDAGLGAMGDPATIAATVEFLFDHAAGGPALEFGIGTGRIAVPLHARGVRVHGIDFSTAMLDRLRAKPDADGITVTQGDFATTTVDGRFSLAYLVFNTIENLTTQDEQVACFRNAADHLGPRGRFVIEVAVPQLQRLPPGETLQPFTATSTHLGIDELDVATQGLISHHYLFDGDHVDVRSIPFRYVWPGELDLMARLAGMSLVERWADWDRSAFTRASRKHISVWETAAG